MLLHILESLIVLTNRSSIIRHLESTYFVRSFRPQTHALHLLDPSNILTVNYIETTCSSKICDTCFSSHVHGTSQHNITPITSALLAAYCSYKSAPTPLRQRLSASHSYSFPGKQRLFHQSTTTLPQVL